MQLRFDQGQGIEAGAHAERAQHRQRKELAFVHHVPFDGSDEAGRLNIHFNRVWHVYFAAAIQCTTGVHCRHGASTVVTHKSAVAADPRQQFFGAMSFLFD